MKRAPHLKPVRLRIFSGNHPLAEMKLKCHQHGYLTLSNMLLSSTALLVSNQNSGGSALLLLLGRLWRLEAVLVAARGRRRGAAGTPQIWTGFWSLLYSRSLACTCFALHSLALACTSTQNKCIIQASMEIDR